MDKYVSTTLIDEMVELKKNLAVIVRKQYARSFEQSE